MPKKEKDSQPKDIYQELLKWANKVFAEADVLLIKKAYLMAKDLHRGQKRNSGEPYIVHPTTVAYIVLAEMQLLDVNSVVASLLHDTIEDCGIDYDFLVKYFNQDVANLVISVTKMKDLDFNSREDKEDYNNSLLLKHILEDYRVIYIKLADRLHNMRTLDYKIEAKRRKKSAETLRIFVPLAMHVGALLARDELADTAFKYLSNSNYREIAAMSKDYVNKHQNMIEAVQECLSRIASNLGICVDISLRVMNNFAIYQGLIHNKKVSLLPNFLAYEVMVDKIDDIKRIVQELESKFEVDDRYTNDFITSPKSHGYQAYHISLIGPKNTPFQIRIFTKEMALVNNYGLAALLKLHPSKSVQEIQAELIRDNIFFRSLDESCKQNKKPFELLDETVRELQAEKINVTAADGTLYCLPAASTVADLADKIHTELKKEAVGALVNGKLVDLSFPLKDDDHVIILTKEKQEYYPLAFQKS